jgi:hypothetical protein
MPGDPARAPERDHSPRHHDQPVPKVIDFGVAKAVDQRLT